MDLWTSWSTASVTYILPRRLSTDQSEHWYRSLILSCKHRRQTCAIKGSDLLSVPQKSHLLDFCRAHISQPISQVTSSFMCFLDIMNVVMSYVHATVFSLLVHRHVDEGVCGVSAAGFAATATCSRRSWEDSSPPAASGQQGGREKLGGGQVGAVAAASGSLGADGETSTPIGGWAGDYDQANYASNLRYDVHLGCESSPISFIWPSEWVGRDPRRCSGVRTEPLCSCRNGLFTEVMNSECMSDRDYQGWVDFGRRDAEWATTTATTTPRARD